MACVQTPCFSRQRTKIQLARTTAGTTWNTTLNESCPFDDPGWVGGLGPLADLQNNGGHRAPRDTEFRALGFGEVLGLNAGAPESGENNMRVYVRR